MPTKLVLSRIVGAGTEADPFRAKVADLLAGTGASYSASIPSNPDGTPRLPWALVKVTADDLTAILANADVEDFLPARALATPLSQLTVAQRQRLAQAVQNRLGFLPDTTSDITLGQALRKIVQRLDGDQAGDL